MNPPLSKRLATCEEGQVLVLLVVFMLVLLGMAGLVIDVGSWYKEDRAAQATADAAALSGAQGLREGTADAAALAHQYATKNDGRNIAVSFGSKAAANDLITVTVARPAPAFFMKLSGVDSVEVNARATAAARVPGAARHVAPIAVYEQHPMLKCGCFGDPTQVVLINLHNPGSSNGAGAFGLVNLDRRNTSGNVGNGTLADWIRNGYDDEMPLGIYHSSPSAGFNSSQVKNALNDRLGTELLFPVYRSITGGGSQAEYDIVAWVGFVPTSYTAAGKNGTVRGYFTQ